MSVKETPSSTSVSLTKYQRCVKGNAGKFYILSGYANKNNWKLAIQESSSSFHISTLRERRKKKKKKEIKHLLSIIDGENLPFCCLDQSKMTSLLSC